MFYYEWNKSLELMEFLYIKDIAGNRHKHSFFFKEFNEEALARLIKWVNQCIGTA